jgi:transcriptional regulator with XRE-family HTH domain
MDIDRAVLDGRQTARDRFAERLGEYRVSKRLTRPEIAKEAGCSASWLKAIEQCVREPDINLGQALDRIFGAEGEFEGLARQIEAARIPGWIDKWLQLEAKAALLRYYEPCVLPGLSQTEGYARALLDEEPDLPEDKIDELLGTRMNRQAILSRKTAPPAVWMLMDEAVLRHEVGSRKVMHEALLALAELGEQRRNVTVQVVPEGAGKYWLANGFALAKDRQGREAAYLDALLEGYTTAKPETVLATGIRFEKARSAALSPAASIDLIRKRAEAWT